MPSANFEAAAKAVKQLKAKPSQDELLQVGFAVFGLPYCFVDVSSSRGSNCSSNLEIEIGSPFSTGLTSKRQFYKLLENPSPLAEREGCYKRKKTLIQCREFSSRSDSIFVHFLGSNLLRSRSYPLCRLRFVASQYRTS